LKRDWIKNLKDERLCGCQISVKTYAGASGTYRKEARDAYDYLVVDEAHHAVAPGLKKMIRYYRPRFLLGLTATDKRLDEKKLEDIFGNYDVQLDLKEAMNLGVLCPIRAYRLDTNIDLSEVRFNRKDYYASDLQRKIFVPERNNVIADTVEKYFGKEGRKKSGIVFCVNVQHAKEIAALLRERGLLAESVDGKDSKRFEKIDKYMSREVQFLCTCSLLTEGWDAPHTEVLVMARPTMSRVLYTQQLGRGTRKAPGKDALYLIDVVDNYGAYGRITNRPWSVHALLGQPWYKPFGDILHPDTDPVEIDTVYQKEMKLSPFDFNTMQELYENYLGEEQLARELFVSTSSVKAWVRKGKILPDVDITIGKMHLRLFSLEQVLEIREQMGLVEHTEEMIVQDFWDFIEKGDYSFSYKMVFINALLNNVDESGEADIDRVLESYQSFYLKRLQQGLQVDRAKSPYNREEMLNDQKAIKKSMLDNPFEKFERKRFMYYAKDLKRISIHHRIWDELSDNGGALRLREKMKEDMQAYFSAL